MDARSAEIIRQVAEQRWTGSELEVIVGGPGSGTWDRGKDRKPLTEENLPLDVRLLHREGLLRPGGTFVVRWYRGRNPENGNAVAGAVVDAAVVLSYRGIHSGEDVTERVGVEWTACHYGGRRPWWECPKCGRRCAVLYASGWRFLCRLCCCLAYPSQRQTKADRLRRKAQAIRRRLGGSGSLLEQFPERPKGMHLDTYWRLFSAADDAEKAALRHQERMLRALRSKAAR